MTALSTIEVGSQPFESTSGIIKLRSASLWKAAKATAVIDADGNYVSYRIATDELGMVLDEENEGQPWPSGNAMGAKFDIVGYVFLNWCYDGHEEEEQRTKFGVSKALDNSFDVIFCGATMPKYDGANRNLKGQVPTGASAQPRLMPQRRRLWKKSRTCFCF